LLPSKLGLIGSYYESLDSRLDIYFLFTIGVEAFTIGVEAFTIGVEAFTIGVEAFNNILFRPD
jgi:hypothetical protein